MLSHLRGGQNNANSQAEESIDYYIALIKEVLDDIEVPSAPESQDKENALWMTSYGSAILITSLFIDKSVNAMVLNVMVPLVKLPEDNILPLFNLCMRLNMNLTDCHLALSDKWGITLTSKRSAAGLDKKELQAIFYRVARAADHMDTQFAEDFKAEMWGQD